MTKAKTQCEKVQTLKERDARKKFCIIETGIQEAVRKRKNEYDYHFTIPEKDIDVLIKVLKKNGYKTSVILDKGNMFDVLKLFPKTGKLHITW